MLVSAVLSLAMAAAALLLGAHLAGVPLPLGPIETEVSGQCLRKLYYMQAGKSDDPYTLPMLFASGKDLPYDAGKYDLCLRIPTARYFLLSLTVARPKVSFPGLGLGADIPLELGLCLPNVCTPNDLTQLVREVWAEPPPFPLPRKLRQLRDFGHLEVRNITSPELDREAPTASTYVAALVLGALASAVLVSTALHEYAEWRLLALAPEPSAERSDDRLEVVQLLRSADPGLYRRLERHPLVTTFSLKVSWRKLLAPSVEQAKPTDHLNGMRVASMCWIILGHSFLMANAIAGYDNPEYVVARKTGKASDVRFQFLIGGHAAVDSFFFISGFLLAHLCLKEQQRRRQQLSPKYLSLAILSRYLRLTPSLAVVLLFYYRVAMYLGDGPFFPRFQHSVTRRCNGTWITELLFTMNFWPWDPDAVCMGWTWYLGCDFIFYILALFILAVYTRRKFFGWLLVGGCFLASVGYTAKDVWVHRLGIYLFDGGYEKYSYYAYSRPWNRFPGYLVGVAAALLHGEHAERRLPPLAPALTLGLSVAGAALMLFVVVVPYTTFREPNSWARWQNVAYIALGRPAWTLGLSIISLACLAHSTPPLAMLSVKSDTSLVVVEDEQPGGLARAPQLAIGLVNQLLSAYLWVPLSRLTYAAYLVHPVVVKLLAANSYAHYHFSYAGILERTAANCVL
eukprot:EG_transcript_5499